MQWKVRDSFLFTVGLKAHHFIDATTQISANGFMSYCFEFVLWSYDNKMLKRLRMYTFLFVFNLSNLFHPGQRDSLSAQLDLTVTKAESEQLARALQEEQYFELSQENKKATSRHKQDVAEKESTIARVSKSNTVVLFTCTLYIMLYIY